MKVLFICNQNMHRSKTAEALFKYKFDTKSAGLYNNSVSKAQLEWADIIMVMDDEQRSELAKRFPNQYMKKRILSLNVSDVYRYNQPELICILKNKVNKLL